MPALAPTLKQLFLLTLLAALLSSCGMLSFGKKQKTEQEQQSARELRYWQAKGKLSLVFQNQANSAYFEWDNRDQEFTIHLHGPLGQGSVYLTKENSRYTLQDGEQEFSEKSAEDLLYSQLGMQFPVSELIYWIRGIRAPGENNITLLPSSEINQKGWKIAYPRRTMKHGYLLPEKLIATRKEVKITMVIKSWDINP